MRRTDRVLWVTNHQAPYREPVWNILSGQLNLLVALIHDKEPRRGWRYRATPKYSSQVLKTRHLPLVGRLMSTYDDPPVALQMREMGLVATAMVVVVGGWDQIAYLQVLSLAWILRIPRVLFYESTLTTHRYKKGPVAWIRRWAMKRADSIITPGTAAFEAAIAAGAPPDRVCVAPNAVDVNRVRTLARARRPKSIPDRHRFVYVGQLIPRKNVDGLLRAFARLKGQPTLDIVGSGESEDDLRALAKALALGQRVRWHGQCGPEEVIGVMAEGQTLALVSHEEVWGMVVNEAIACGLSVVVARHVGVAADVGECPGVYVVEGDIDSISAGLEESRSDWRTWDDSAERIASLTPAASAHAISRVISRLTTKQGTAFA